MPYMVWLKEAGEGCDYTIGCGEKLFPLKSNEADDIHAEVIDILSDHGFPNRESYMDQVVVLEVKFRYDVKVLADKMQELDEDEEDDETKARRLMYEKLKQEFG